MLGKYQSTENWNIIDRIHFWYDNNYQEILVGILLATLAIVEFSLGFVIRGLIK